MIAIDEDIMQGRIPPMPSMHDNGPAEHVSYYWDARREALRTGFVAAVDVHDYAVRHAARAMGSALASLRSIWNQ